MTLIRIMFTDGGIILMPNDSGTDIDVLIAIHHPSVYSHYDADDISDMDII